MHIPPARRIALAPIMNRVAIEFRKATKRFGQIVANEDLSFGVERGTIHAIVGENGAGKSTAMKLLYGLFLPDSGELFVQGKPVVWRSPADAIRAGLGMVHQHFMLAGPYTVLDNILLGAEPTRWWRVCRAEATRTLGRRMSQYGLRLDLMTPVEDLSVSAQQQIEILKLLYREAEILLLDEPTAVLTPQEVTKLFGTLRQLKSEGKTILLVTHKLKEVLEIADFVTVLRRGRVTGHLPAAQATVQELANLMVGGRVNLDRTVRAGTAGRPAIEIKELTARGPRGGEPVLSNINMTVRQGEIVGIAGVEGNGQSALMRLLTTGAGSGFRLSGKIELLGQNVIGWTARHIRSLGVSLIPEDRLRQALIADWPVADNFLLGWQRTRDNARLGFINHARAVAGTRDALDRFRIQPGDPAALAGSLSGGNQQKLVIAREFQAVPNVVLAAHPTRGVDVGAIEVVHDQIVRARDAGAAVLLISSELEEILGLADRILVVFRGRIVAEFAKGRVTEMELGVKMGGG